MAVLQKPKNLKEAELKIYYSDGANFSRPEKYRGYYASYTEFNPAREGDMGRGIIQRILLDLSEQTEENDKKALAVFDEFLNGI
jgi:hypothetical protein